jgi:DNA polymerase
MLAEMGIRTWAPLDDAAPTPATPAARAAAPASSAAAAGNTAQQAAPALRQGLDVGLGTRPASGAGPANPPASPSVDPATRAAARPVPGKPQPARAETPAAAVDSHAPTRPAAPAASSIPATGPAPIAVPAELADLDWPAFQARLAQAVLPEGETRVLSGHGDAQARWLFIGDAPSDAPVAAPVAGGRAAPAEQLLDNMLRACGLSRQAGAFLAYTHHATQDAAGSQGHAWMARLVELLQPRVIVLMSRYATQSLLQTPVAPGRLRGQALEAFGIPVVVSYPPSLLLGKADQKAKAWADLCRAKALAAG